MVQFLFKNRRYNKRIDFAIKAITFVILLIAFCTGSDNRVAECNNVYDRADE